MITINKTRKPDSASAGALEARDLERLCHIERPWSISNVMKQWTGWGRH